ncbi:hypothetical protein BKA60DRAFT_546010 [Fusarium oxysporum]|nr:hypothetical protein BKA60DRAFT_546010 [Fusarium oxysporum]
MQLPISLFLPALWAASSVVGKGPSGLQPLPDECKSCCAVGVTCPENDGCVIQGRRGAEGRCSTSIESVIAAEQTSCAASISASISAQQTSCAASIQAAAASAGQKCAVMGWGPGDYYQDVNGVNVAGCKAKCLADSRCRSYSANVVLSNFPASGAHWHECYLYGKAAKDMPVSYDPAWAMYDRNCP